MASTNTNSDKPAGEKTQQQAGGIIGTISNTASGVAGTTGGILGGAVSAAGGVLGSVGRGLGEGITNAANTTESIAKNAGEQINETSGAKQQGKEQSKWAMRRDQEAAITQQSLRSLHAIEV